MRRLPGWKRKDCLRTSNSGQAWRRERRHEDVGRVRRRVPRTWTRFQLRRDGKRQGTRTETQSRLNGKRRFGKINEGLFQAERPGPHQTGSATVGPSKPATLGHCRTIECEEASAVTPNSTDNGEKRFSASSRLRDLNRSATNVPSA